jgi:hypothetical protein
MKRAFTAILVALVIHGCTAIGHKEFYEEFYSQVAPTKYPPTEKLMVFEYANVDLKEIYDLLFSDFLVIGRSSFNGPYENPSQSVSYAKSIGANIVISSSQFQETRTSFMNLSTPTSSTTYLSGYSGSGSYYGTATTYGTKTTTIPVAVNRYDQHGLFLRNVNNVVPLWERTDTQYKKTEPSEFEGVWFNENYRLNVYRSGHQLVGFISGSPKERQDWNAGQLKFIYGVESGVGVFLMANKTPMPAQFSLNKFGHFEVKLISSKETFSFAREPYL